MRTVTPEQLTAAVRDHVGDRVARVVASGNLATPFVALASVDAALATYRLFALNAHEGVPDRDGVVHETPFVGPAVRRSPRLRYLPARLSLVPRLFAPPDPPDLVVVHTTPPRDGRVSLGIEVNVLPAAIEAARSTGGLVVAQVNRSMPWTHGDAELDVADVDLALEADGPLPSPARPVLDACAEAIGGRVAPLVGHGSTLQLGIGAVPDAVLAALTGRRHLRLWTEMLSDGVLALERAGCFDPDVALTTSFLFGSQELYAWVDDNPRLRLLRTERVNDPGVIAAQPLMTSINTALQVDLSAQANASWAGTRVHSGFGGQTDFVVGALHATGGQAVIALPAWHPKADCSTVVPRLQTPVTSFQHSWVVSDRGSAKIWGRSQREQAHDLVERVADPRARDELREHAREAGLVS